MFESLYTVSGRLQKVYFSIFDFDIDIAETICKTFHKSLRSIAISIRTNNKTRLESFANYILCMANLKSFNGIVLIKATLN